jgi:glycosyltransferase involved in cell wall biosynthesis
MVGTRGVPARYGGFETCVEEVGRRLASAGHEIVVYCREADQRNYLGMERVGLPALRHRAFETLSHTALSTTHLVTRRRLPDAAFVFNAANSPLIPILHSRHVPVILHMDGLEWRRSKWGPVGRRYYQYAEALGVYLADCIISDAEAISDYYRHTYGVASSTIAYGAPIVSPHAARLSELELTAAHFCLIVARTEPENHVRESLLGALADDSDQPIVLVGSVPYESTYSREVAAIARSSSRVRHLGSLWDQELLDVLYAHCRIYIHGHSVGGTNPSLLRAMGAGAAVAAYDCRFNRETLAGDGLFWDTPEYLGSSLTALTEQSRARLRLASRTRAASHYRWDDIADAYLRLAESVTKEEPSDRGTGLSGRRALRAASTRRTFDFGSFC